MMSTATLFSNEATDLSITVAAATIARVPEDIRVDEGLQSDFQWPYRDLSMSSAIDVTSD
jgi:hypothetical protein